MSTSASLTTLKPLIVCITTNCGKCLKRWEYQPTIPVFWEACIQDKKWRWNDTWFKIGKGVHQDCILSPCLFNSHAVYIKGNAVQCSSVTQSCPTLWDPMNCNTSGLPVHQQFPEFTRTHVRWWLPGGSDGKASVYNAGDLDSIPWSGRSPGEGNGNPLQYSCLENPMEGEAW